MKNQLFTLAGSFLVCVFLSSWTSSNYSYCSERQVKHDLNYLSQGTDPTLTILGKSAADREMTLSEVQQLDFIKMEESFKTKGYEVASFKLVYIYEGNIVEISGEGMTFTPVMKTELNRLEINDKFSVEQINIISPNGDMIKMPAFSFQIGK
ncbi:MAG: hypothetical protein AB8B53_12005 [Flavobacteriales bacterium]